MLSICAKDACKGCGLRMRVRHAGYGCVLRVRAEDACSGGVGLKWQPSCTEQCGGKAKDACEGCVLRMRAKDAC